MLEDLVDELRKIDYSSLPDDYNCLLTGPSSPITDVTGGPIILDRILDLAQRTLIFQRGRSQGKPDLYNQGQLQSYGFTVTEENGPRHGWFTGVIHTRKGKIVFEG